jgi:hypothetical protein
MAISVTLVCQKFNVATGEVSVLTVDVVQWYINSMSAICKSLARGGDSEEGGISSMLSLIEELGDAVVAKSQGVRRCLQFEHSGFISSHFQLLDNYTERAGGFKLAYLDSPDFTIPTTKPRFPMRPPRRPIREGIFVR